MTNSILVTGSEGFVGKHLCNALHDSGREIQQCDLALGHDVTLLETFGQFSKPSAIVHLAALLKGRKSQADLHQTFHVNVTGTLNALEAARRWDAAFIFASSYVYGIPKHLPINESHPVAATNPYMHSKILAEGLCRRYADEYGLSVMIFRPFNIYGPGQSKDFLIPSILKQLASGTIILKDGSPRRDHVHVSDVVRAYIMALPAATSGCAVFNLGTGQSFSVSEVVEIIKKHAGTIEIKFTGAERPNDVPDCYADISKIRRELGWNPQISLTQGLAALVKQALNAPQSES